MLREANPKLVETVERRRTTASGTRALKRRAPELPVGEELPVPGTAKALYRRAPLPHFAFIVKLSTKKIIQTYPEYGDILKYEHTYKQASTVVL